MVVSLQDQLRNDPLTSLQAPLLFIRGTGDAYCEGPQFDAILKRMASPSVEVIAFSSQVGSLTSAQGTWHTLQGAKVAGLMLAGIAQVHEVEGGDHSLKVKGGKKAVEEALAAACSAAVAFVQQLVQADTAGDSAKKDAHAGAEPAAHKNAQSAEADVPRKRNKREKASTEPAAAASGAGTKKRTRRSAQ